MANSFSLFSPFLILFITVSYRFVFLLNLETVIVTLKTKLTKVLKTMFCNKITKLVAAEN